MSEPDWVRPVVHWEIRGNDPARLRMFYSQMFNWPIGEGPVMNIPAGIGAPDAGPAGHIMDAARAGQPPGVSLYIQVRDLDASLAKAVALGGAKTRDRFDIPGGPTIAGIADPEGTPIVLVQQ
jgi:hypothetical protein